MAPPPQIVEISAAEAAPIRRAVLRRGTPSDAVDFPGDDDPGTVHLGVMVGDRVVAVSTWLRDDAAPHGPTEGVHRMRLRGMATLDEYQGQGLGARMIEEGARRAKEHGAVEIWANARDTALAFYRQHGFDVVGDGFLTPDTQLPHHVVRLPL